MRDICVCVFVCVPQDVLGHLSELRRSLRATVSQEASLKQQAYCVQRLAKVNNPMMHIRIRYDIPGMYTIVVLRVIFQSVYSACGARHGNMLTDVTNTKRKEKRKVYGDWTLLKIYENTAFSTCHTTNGRK